jgi:hypothetical protein
LHSARWPLAQASRWHKALQYENLLQPLQTKSANGARQLAQPGSVGSIFEVKGLLCVVGLGWWAVREHHAPAGG